MFLHCTILAKSNRPTYQKRSSIKIQRSTNNLLMVLANYRLYKGFLILQRLLRFKMIVCVSQSQRLQRVVECSWRRRVELTSPRRKPPPPPSDLSMWSIRRLRRNDGGTRRVCTSNKNNLMDANNDQVLKFLELSTIISSFFHFLSYLIIISTFTTLLTLFTSRYDVKWDGIPFHIISWSITNSNRYNNS